MSEIKIFNIMLEYTLLFYYYCFLCICSLYIIIRHYYSFLYKANFCSCYLFFPLELRLPMAANLVSLLKVYYILGKSLPVEVWVKDKPFRFFVGKYFIIIYVILKQKNDIFLIFISLKTKTLNKLTLKTKFPKK